MESTSHLGFMWRFLQIREEHREKWQGKISDGSWRSLFLRFEVWKGRSQVDSDAFMCILTPLVITPFWAVPFWGISGLESWNGRPSKPGSQKPAAAGTGWSHPLPSLCPAHPVPTDTEPAFRTGAGSMSSWETSFFESGFGCQRSAEVLSHEFWVLDSAHWRRSSQFTLMKK